MNKVDGDKLLKVSEAADRLGCGTTTIWSLIRDRSLPAVRVKGAVRVSSEDIQKYKAAHPY